MADQDPTPPPGVWAFDRDHSQVGFAARHLGLGRIRGTLGTVSGTVVIAEVPERSHATVLVDVRDLHTGSDDRDEHLRSEDFLDVVDHPIAELRTTGIERRKGSWAVRADLTVRGVTRRVVLDVVHLGTTTHERCHRAFFTATTHLDRAELGMTWGDETAAARMVVGRTVTLTIDVELVRRAA